MAIDRDKRREAGGDVGNASSSKGVANNSAGNAGHSKG